VAHLFLGSLRVSETASPAMLRDGGRRFGSPLAETSFFARRRQALNTTVPVLLTPWPPNSAIIRRDPYSSLKLATPKRWRRRRPG
jgi:hypothetical protein